jgi:ribonuclease III
MRLVSAGIIRSLSSGSLRGSTIEALKANSSLDAWQAENAVHFDDETLLRRALTHPSYLNEHPGRGLQDNQRLEFLGDAILAFVSGEWLFNRFTDAPEGRLTRLRAALVRTETLATFADECHIGAYMLVGKGEAESGGREREANLCDAFEAVIGALYLDQGIEVVRAFVNPRFEAVIDEILRDERDKDPKSRLQEWSQRHIGQTPVYETISMEGPDHAKEFTVTVRIGGSEYAQGTGSRKQIAEQVAAQRALEVLLAGQ